MPFPWFPSRPARLGSTHTFVPLRALSEGIACFWNPNGERRYCALLEITGKNFALLSETEQEAIFQLYQRFYSTLPFPTQLLVRVTRLDLSAYTRFLAPLSEEPGGLAASHTAFLHQHTTNTMLLERRFYLVVSADPFAVETAPWRRNARRKAVALSHEQAWQQVQLRVEQITTGLQQLDLHVHRLENPEIVRLFDAYYGAQRATQQPLTEEALQTALSTQMRLDDVLAPSSIRIEKDALCLDEREWLCVLALRGLPRLVAPGFLQQLIMLDEEMDLVFHQFPLKQEEALRLLRRKQTHYQSSLQSQHLQGRTANPHLHVAAQDIEPLIERIAGGEEQLHEHAIHLLVRAPSREELNRRVQRLLDTAYTVSSHRPHVLHFEQERGFRTCIPGSFHPGSRLPLPSSAVAACFPFFSNLVYRPTPTALLEGITMQQEPVVVDWWDELANANRFLLAPSGSGKSYKCKLDIMRLLMMDQARARRGETNGEQLQIIVIDPEREYQRLCTELGGQWIRFSPGSAHHLNPFDLPRRRHQRAEAAALTKENILANQIQRLHLLLDMMLAHRSPENPDATLSVEEKALLDIALYECYRKVGISSDPETHQRPAPLLRDLSSTLESGDCGEDTTGLARRLKRYVKGSLSGLFTDQTNVSLENPFVVFDVRDLDDELRPIALLMIAHAVWNLSFASTMPRLLIIDELATLYRYRAGARFAEEMFQRARKQYLAITGITQHPRLFQESAILANCATHILFRQDHTTAEEVGQLFKLSSREIQLVRSFRRGEALMLMDGKRMPVRFLASEQEHRLATTNPRELAEQWTNAQHSSTPAPPQGPEHNGVKPQRSTATTSNSEEQVSGLKPFPLTAVEPTNGTSRTQKLH